MSISYSIQLKLYTVLDKDNIRLILLRAKKINVIFFEGGKYEYFDIEKNISIDVESAVQKIFATYKDAEHSGIIVAKKDETLFLLSFNQEDTDLIVNLTLLAYDWEKEFIDGQISKDLAQHISLLLIITQDFSILDIGIRRL